MGTKVAVVGLGYVGLPLVHHLSTSGIQVSGYDIDSKKIKSLKSGTSYIGDVSDSDLRALQGVVFSEDPAVLRGASLISICVHTPIDAKQNPDYGPMISAIQTVRAHADAGSIVVIESTVGPGFTSAMAQTQLSDFGVVFSPERVDPSNTEFPIHQIPKVAGSDDADVYARFEEIYGRAFTLYRMPNSTSAELVKLLENTFRAVNLGFIHEFDRICRGFDVDTRGGRRRSGDKAFRVYALLSKRGCWGSLYPCRSVLLIARARVCVHPGCARY
jgi:UDP-N-acetyl-D-glucosamine dehydrogenase